VLYLFEFKLGASRVWNNVTEIPLSVEADWKSKTRVWRCFLQRVRVSAGHGITVTTAQQSVTIAYKQPWITGNECLSRTSAKVSSRLDLANLWPRWTLVWNFVLFSISKLRANLLIFWN
jgi:hypothetical protein